MRIKGYKTRSAHSFEIDLNELDELGMISVSKQNDEPTATVTLLPPYCDESGMQMSLTQVQKLVQALNVADFLGACLESGKTPPPEQFTIEYQ
jgi:hypothetical protein